MIKYIIIFLFGTFISSMSQIVLKKSANKQYDNPIKEYLNFPVLFSYFVFFLASLITVVAYKYVPLSLGPVLESSGYIFVSILGYIFLKERIGKRKLLGILLIILGIGISSF